MAALLTKTMTDTLRERYEFGTPAEKRSAFEKLRESHDEALRIIERLSHAKVTGEAKPTGDFFDQMFGRKRGANAE